MNDRSVVVCALAGIVAVACGRPQPAPLSLRLIDSFPAATVEGRTAIATDSAEPEWAFADPERARGWRAGHEIEGLRVVGGRLRGRTGAGTALIHAERAGPLGDDLLHSVEIRAQVSRGANLAVEFRRELSMTELLGNLSALPPSISTPLIAGDEVQTYLLTLSRPVQLAGTRNVIILPSDEAGAEFAIESVRLISRREHLASIPSGIGWHGLDGVYRETIVSRSPETILTSLRLPARPRLDVALGTLEGAPVTFRVAVGPPGATGTDLLRRTVTRADRWETVDLDLSSFAGREVELALSLEAAEDGALGLWGSPVVRTLGSGAGADGGANSVLLIVTDTLRKDRLQPYGHSRETSPHLSRLASEGSLFQGCVAQATWTKVSVSSIMTSLYPPSHGVLGFTDRLPASAATLAESFREAGWATLGLSSIGFNGSFTNLHQGFEVFHESASLPDGLDLKTARVHVDRLLPWLERHREVPFFAVLHVADPHSPFSPYAPYDELWAAPGARATHDADVEKARGVIRDPLMKRFGMPDRRELEQVGIDPELYVERELAWYDASIRAMDAEVGRVLERLDQLGLADSTLVAVVADHGEEFLEHGRDWHGHAVYGELSRVPLILRGPRVTPGTVVGQTVQTIDLMPTLLELAGLPIPAGAQGRSLVPLLSGAGAGGWPDRPAFTTAVEIDGPVSDEVPAYPQESYGVVDDGWLLVHNARRPDSHPEYELYRDGDDPLHQTDVSGQHPEVVERLARTLTAWKAKTESERLDDDAALQNVDADELERLRSLGYVN